MYKIWFCLIALLISSAATAQSSAPPANPASGSDAECTSSAQATKAAGFEERYPRYRIGAGDVFDVNFEFAPEFNQTVTVQPDGFITLRDAGDIHAGGLSVPELTTALCKAYSKIMASPSIAILLKNFEKPYFVAGGQVVRPGKYELRGDTTLTEAIAMAGGFTDRSKHSQVLLFRRVSAQWSEAKVVDVKKMLNARNLGEDIFLQPGDMFVVPQNRISKIQRFMPNANVATYVNPTQF
jgi:polysaccharide biosynthesis/export protein